MSKKTIKIFVERNMGNGFEKAYPRLPSILYHFFVWLIGKPSQPLIRKFGFLIYHRCEIDKDCKDPRAIGRSPKIEMNAIFPWRFNDKLLMSKKGNDLLQSCWQAALATTTRGVTPKLEVELPSEWYIKKQ
jgi:hypothetical protein